MLRTTLAIAALLGLALAGPARASEKKATTSPQKQMTFEGEIISVDVPAQDFTVKNIENGVTHEMKFHVDKPLEVRLDGQSVPLVELQKGDRVTVTYDTDGQIQHTRSVHRSKAMKKES